MRITDVKTFLVSPQRGKASGKLWLFVKLETDAGVVGWGEAYTTSDREQVTASHVHALRPYLIGRDPFHIKHWVTMVHRDYAIRRSSLELSCAVSATEQAMWDIMGQALGVPVHALLGGPVRPRIRVYANGWGGGASTPEHLAEQARAVVARGFTALKFDPFPGRWRLFIDRQEEELAVERVRAVREAVGPEVDVLVEVHRRLAPMHAVRVARLMEPYAPFWYEEPVPAESTAALAEVRQAINLPVVTGETLTTKAEFLPILEARAADILNPDICCCGIMELREIAAMAEPYLVAVAPHNYNSTVLGLAATLHLAACLPNFVIAEYFVNFAEAPATRAILTTPPFELVDGHIPLPTAPGLGQALSEEALRAWTADERAPRSLPTANEERW